MGHESVTHGRVVGVGSGSVVCGVAVGGYPPRLSYTMGWAGPAGPAQLQDGPRWSRSAAGRMAAARCLHTGLTALITVA